MDQLEYALGVFAAHERYARVYLPSDFTVLEFGPGDSVATAVLAKVAGASRSWLVDQGAFASRDLAGYQALAQRVSSDPQFESLEELLERCAATYLTAGVSSLAAVPSGSVDWVFSQAALEHVPLDEFDSLLHEIARVQRPGGVSTHRIDLRDHLGDGLHSLRFPTRVWESKLFRTSGFYTNRLRASEINRRFTACGFSIETCELDRWPAPKLGRARIAHDLRGILDEDLLIRGIWLVVRRN